MAKKHTLKNLSRKGLSLLLAAVMTTSLIQVSAFATEGTETPSYEVGDTITDANSDRELPVAPEGTYWDGPVSSPDLTAEPTCGIEPHEHNDLCTFAPITEDQYAEGDPDQFKVENFAYYKLICEVEEDHEHSRDCYTEKYDGWDYHDFPRPSDGAIATVDGIEYMCKWDGWNSGWYALTCATEVGHKHTLDNCYTTENATAEDHDRAELASTNYYQYEDAAHTHTDDCYPVVYTWTLKAYTADSVKIVDNILTNGCLEAQVSGKAANYQWYKNGVAIEGATDATLDAFDTNHNAVVTAPNTYTVKAFGYQDNEGVESRSYTAQYYTEIQNGSFETPDLGRSAWRQYPNGTPHLFWKTTGSDGQVELFQQSSSSHFPARNASIPEGDQAGEINAEAYGALYQDVLTEPGSTLYWSLFHRGRNGNDTMYVIIAGAGQNLSDLTDPDLGYVQAQIVDGNRIWKYHASSNEGYKVPAGQYVTRFYFLSVDAAGGATQGNLIDDVKFSSTKAPDPVPTYSWTINYYVDGSIDHTDSGRAEDGSVVLPAKLADYLNSYDVKPGEDYTTTAPSLTVTAGGENVLNLYFVTSHPSIVHEVTVTKDFGVGLTTGSGRYQAGANATVTFELHPGYELISVTDWDGSEASPEVVTAQVNDCTYMIEGIQKDHHINITTKKSTYTLNVQYLFADNKKPATGFENYSVSDLHYGDSYEANAIAAPAGYTRTDSGNTTGTITGNTDVYYLYTPNGSASVTVYYVDAETGEHLLRPQTQTGLIGTEFEVSDLKLNSINAKGKTYDLVNTDENMDGTYQKGGTIIRLLYNVRPEPTYTLNVYYMFADGKKPATGFVDYTETNFHYGDSYEAKAIAAPAGYTRTDSGNTAGTITGNTDVYYLYTPNGNASVTVYYVNAETGVHILAPKSETGLIGTDFDVSGLKLDSIEYKGTTYDLVNVDEVMAGTYKIGGTDIRLLYKEHTSSTDPDPDPDPNPGHSKNYYYRVDYVYTGYDKDGKEIYSDKTEGSVTKTSSSSYTLKNDADRTHDGHTFVLVSDAKMTGSLSGHTSKNNPYVFTVYYEFTELDDGTTPGGDKPPVDGGDSTGSVDKPTDGNNTDGGKDIPDDKVPTTDVPKTGDSMTLWVLAAAASGAGLIWLAISGKKRKEEF